MAQLRQRRISQALAALAFLLGIVLTNGSPAAAGDSWTPNADCWRTGSPYICRYGWGGPNSSWQVQWLNMMASNQTTLLNDAITAMNNWNNAPGPQHQGFNASTGATRVYLWTDTSLGFGSATTANYDGNGNIIPFMGGTGTILFSDIKTSPQNATNTMDMRIWLHELGHALALGHHSNENAGVMWPWSNQFQYDNPTSFDIGPNPPCSGVTSSYMGLRCIYDYGL